METNSVNNRRSESNNNEMLHINQVTRVEPEIRTSSAGSFQNIEGVTADLMFRGRNIRFRDDIEDRLGEALKNVTGEDARRNVVETIIREEMAEGGNIFDTDPTDHENQKRNEWGMVEYTGSLDPSREFKPELRDAMLAHLKKDIAPVLTADSPNDFVLTGPIILEYSTNTGPEGGPGWKPKFPDTAASKALMLMDTNEGKRWLKELSAGRYVEVLRYDVSLNDDGGVSVEQKLGDSFFAGEDGTIHKLLTPSDPVKDFDIATFMMWIGFQRIENLTTSMEGIKEKLQKGQEEANHMSKLLSRVNGLRAKDAKVLPDDLKGQLDAVFQARGIKDIDLDLKDMNEDQLGKGFDAITEALNSEITAHSQITQQQMLELQHTMGLLNAIQTLITKVNESHIGILRTIANGIQ